MDKYPWMQFFSGDWLKDPSVSKCSPVTRGVWIDFLCVMHESDRSGVITGTREQLARLGRCSAVELDHAIEELKGTSAADVTVRDDAVTVINRRMNREYKSRKANTLRVERFREKRPCNADVTGHISEVRSQKSETQERASVMAGLRAELNKTYRRGESDAWSNIEETTLFDISKRPGAIEELQHILLFRSKMQPDDRRRFFPQTLYALLDRWTEALDKARIQAPIKKPIAFPIKKALSEKAISIEDLKSSLEWTRINTPDAKEAIATLERRIEEMAR